MLLRGEITCNIFFLFRRQSDKQLLWDSLKEELEEKIRLLEEDRQDVDMLLFEQGSRSGEERRRKADPMDPDQRKKPVTVSGPFMVYMLDELEILDDWALIKKAIAHRKKRNA